MNHKSVAAVRKQLKSTQITFLIGDIVIDLTLNKPT